MKNLIKTPDQRLRVFISSTLQELAEERIAVKEAIMTLNLIPVMFELGARPYPPRELYTAYLQQSHIFIGIYWQQYGWVAPDMNISGLEDELQLSVGMPRLIYIKEPAPDRSDELRRLLNHTGQSGVSYKAFKNVSELNSLVINDLSILFTERFESSIVQNKPNLESDELNEEYPVPPFPIVGREHVITNILNLIQTAEVRLLTLIGTGGVGKTRVALEVLRRVKIANIAEVCFVPLASIDNPAILADTILRKAFPAATGGVSPLQTLIELFKIKKVLLVLDNFEHLIDGRLVVSELLKHCPNLQILVTSRELLLISGEFEYGLQPLELFPTDKKLNTLEYIPASAELFIQRSRNIHPGFVLNDENYESIKEICALLDGIPLALELAAARTRLLSPDQILNLLKKNLDVLKAGTHDIPDRHQTLRATIEWSFRLLSLEQQQILFMLSTLSFGGTLEAAIYIGSDIEFDSPIWNFPRKGFYLSESIEDIFPQDGSDFYFLETAESLLSKSMVNTSVNKNGTLRLNFYQTIRHYCLGKLRESGLEQVAYKKHLMFFLHMAESVWINLKSESAEDNYIILDNDIFNIESALKWSVQNEPLLGLRLAIAMAEYWDTRGRSQDTRYWIEKLLKSNTNNENDNFDIFCIAKLELSRALFRLMEIDRSWDLSATCLLEASKRNNIYLMTDALVIQSLINVYAHRNEDKDQIIEKAISFARTIDYKMALLDCIQFKAADKIFSGHASEGVILANESLIIAEECKAKRWEAISHIFIGFGYLNISSFDKSKYHFLKALICTQNLSEQLLPVYSLLGLGQIYLAIGKIPKSCQFLGVIDTFLNKPGTSLVPIVSSFYISTLEHLKSLHLDDLEELLNKGRIMRLNDGIKLALDEFVDDIKLNETEEISKTETAIKL